MTAKKNRIAVNGFTNASASLRASDFFFPWLIMLRPFLVLLARTSSWVRPPRFDLPGHDFGEGASCAYGMRSWVLYWCLIEAVLILLYTAGGAAALLHGLQCACFPFSWLECRTGYSREPARCCVCSCICRPAAVVLSLSLKLLAPFRICDYLENRKAAEPSPRLDSCGFLAIR